MISVVARFQRVSNFEGPMLSQGTSGEVSSKSLWLQLFDELDFNKDSHFQHCSPRDPLSQQEIWKYMKRNGCSPAYSRGIACHKSVGFPGKSLGKSLEVITQGFRCRKLREKSPVRGKIWPTNHSLKYWRFFWNS